MKKWVFALTFLLIPCTVGISGGGGDGDGVDILPSVQAYQRGEISQAELDQQLIDFAKHYGGGGDPGGVDILPFVRAYERGEIDTVLTNYVLHSIARESASGGSTSYSLQGTGRGLTMIVGPPVGTADGEVTVSVTITGTVGAFGGDSVDSQCTDIPYDPEGNCTFDMTLEKRNTGSPDDDCDQMEDVERDKNKVDLEIDAPWDELNDGDNEDDDIGNATGYHPYLGWGGGPVFG